MTRIGNLWDRAVRFFANENHKARSAEKRPSALLELLEDRTVPTGNLFTPVYQSTFNDAVTQDNAVMTSNGQRVWTVDAGADNYQIDLYERPTDDDFQLRKLANGTKAYAIDKYFENLDIKQGKAGFDANYMYVSIEMAGRSESSSNGREQQKGLIYQYGFRISNNADGGGGILVLVDSPSCGWRATSFSSDDISIYQDKNGDVGGVGLDVTREDRPAERLGNGYEKTIVNEGRTKNGSHVVWARVNPNNSNAIEIVLDYKKLGYTASDLSHLPYFDFQANKGMNANEKYTWNDEYTKKEAGSPYGSANNNGKSEFGTNGLGKIHSVDTLRGGPIGSTTPEPGTGSLSGTVFLDMNDNALQDPNENGIAGVSLKLTGIDDQGNAVTQTVVTDANGNYTFANLRAGTYQITETQPIEYADSSDAVGNLGGAVENDYLFDIQIAEGAIGQGYNFAEIAFPNV